MADMPARTTHGDITIDMNQFMADLDGDGIPDARPLPGVVVVTPQLPNGYVVDTVTKATYYGFAQTLTLDDDGRCSATLLACDSPELYPTNWWYSVKVQPAMGPARNFKIQILGGQSKTLGELLIAADDATPPPSGMASVLVGNGPPSSTTLGNLYLDKSTGNLYAKK